MFTKSWSKRLLPLALMGWACNAPSDPEGTLPDAAGPRPRFTDAELRDPRSCQGCHPGQYAEWQGSMHAYAAEDPVFLAMNRRGQEETGGALGDFCVGCHAPLAVRDGLTEDGLNLEELPADSKGITCYVCHSAERILGDHNNQVELAKDGVLRGPFADPRGNIAHASTYSSLLDATHEDSSAMCGACHDLTLPSELVGSELPLERTFAEWKTTLFARAHQDGGLGCAACHMPASPERERSAEVSGAPERRSRRHDFEAIDLAITPFPNAERQRLLAERLLDTSLLAELCVSRVGVIEVTLENAGSGHSWPSGASHDREPWLEVLAYTAEAAEPVYATREPSRDDGGYTADPNLVVLKDFAVDAQARPAHMFWDIREIDRSSALPGVLTRDPLHPEFHRERARWLFNTEQAGSVPLELVTLRVRVRPIALGVLSDLVESGHLEQQFLDAMPVLDVLPDRCHDAEVRARHGVVLGSGAPDCEGDADRAFTLVWRRSEAEPGHPRYRESRVLDVPADCMSHPSYVR